MTTTTTNTNAVDFDRLAHWARLDHMNPSDRRELADADVETDIARNLADVEACRLIDRWVGRLMSDDDCVR